MRYEDQKALCDKIHLGGFLERKVVGEVSVLNSCRELALVQAGHHYAFAAEIFRKCRPGAQNSVAFPLN